MKQPTQSEVEPETDHKWRSRVVVSWVIRQLIGNTIRPWTRQSFWFWCTLSYEEEERIIYFEWSERLFKY